MFGTVTEVRPADFEQDVAWLRIQLDSRHNGCVSVAIKNGLMIHREWPHKGPSCWNIFRLRPGDPYFEKPRQIEHQPQVPVEGPGDPEPVAPADEATCQGGIGHD